MTIRELITQVLQGSAPTPEQFEQALTALEDRPLDRREGVGEATIVDFRDRLDWWVAVILRLHEDAVANSALRSVRDGSSDGSTPKTTPAAIKRLQAACSSEPYWITRGTRDDAYLRLAAELEQLHDETGDSTAQQASKTLIELVSPSNTSEIYLRLRQQHDQERHGQAMGVPKCHCCNEAPCIGEKSLLRVFYATNRARKRRDRGPNRDALYYRFTERTTSRDSKLHLESVEVAIPKIGRKGGYPEPPKPENSQEWKVSGRCTYFVIKPGVTPYANLRAFAAGIESERIASGKERNQKGTLLLYLHGINTSLAEAVSRAAQLFSDCGFSGAPVVLSWPASTKWRSSSRLQWPAKMFSGAGPAVANAFSDHFLAPLVSTEKARAEEVRQFCSVIQHVVREGRFARIVFASHSFGCQYALEVLKKLPIDIARATCGILAAPAIPRSDFEDQVKRLTGKISPLTVYTDQTDGALELFKDAGFGEPAGSMPTDIAGLADVIELSGLPLPIENSSSDPYGHMKIALACDDISLLVDNNYSADVRFTRAQNIGATGMRLMRKEVRKNTHYYELRYFR